MTAALKVHCATFFWLQFWPYSPILLNGCKHMAVKCIQNVRWRALSLYFLVSGFNTDWGRWSICILCISLYPRSLLQLIHEMHSPYHAGTSPSPASAAASILWLFQVLLLAFLLSARVCNSGWVVPKLAGVHTEHTLSKQNRICALWWFRGFKSLALEFSVCCCLMV